MSNTKTTTEADRIRTVLAAIAADMKADAAAFDGRPFTGATVGEYMGNHGAAIAALADIVASLLPEVEPERDPVPFKDYLPTPPSLRVPQSRPAEPVMHADVSDEEWRRHR